MKPEHQNILLVEDNPADARLMVELLTEVGAGRFKLRQSDRISTALDLLRAEIIDVILLDLSLPDGSGLETVQRMCAADPDLPIIVLTGLEDDTLALEAVQAGAQDYLVKGQVDGSGIARSIRYAIERKRLEERMQHLAMHDALTDLPNRRLFDDRLKQAIQRTRRANEKEAGNVKMAVLLLDLDNFKSVNDTLGHSQGDLLLQVVAKRLQTCIRKVDSLSRMGGDEFTMIFEDVSGKGAVEILAGKILAVFSRPFKLGAHTLTITASIGVSLYPCDAGDSETLLKHADIAMYRAKSEHNKLCFFDESKDCL